MPNTASLCSVNQIASDLWLLILTARNSPANSNCYVCNFSPNNQINRYFKYIHVTSNSNTSTNRCELRDDMCHLFTDNKAIKSSIINIKCHSLAVHTRIHSLPRKTPATYRLNSHCICNITPDSSDMGKLAYLHPLNTFLSC